jgi:hypothetical protein
MQFFSMPFSASFNLWPSFKQKQKIEGKESNYVPETKMDHPVMLKTASMLFLIVVIIRC